MARIVVFNHKGGGQKSHIFVWPSHGAGVPLVTTVARHPWRLYGRFGGVHGHLFVWDRALAGGGSPTPPPPPMGGRRNTASWIRRYYLMDLKRP